MRLSHTLFALAAASAFAAAPAHSQTTIGGGKGAVSFPITISQPGNYKLAADLVVPAGVDGIVVTADNVTLDLNGYSVTGAGTCSGVLAQLTCTGTKVGIAAQKRNLTVRNGRVAGFAWGVALPFGGLAEDLAIEYNSTAGLAIYSWGIARGIRTYVNILGIDARNSLVRDSSVAFGTVGISLMAGLVQGVNISAVMTGLQGLSALGGLRETNITATTQIVGSVSSMGNNLCNGLSC